MKVDIEIDGGINFENCTLAKNAGANILVSGSTIFKKKTDNLKKNIEILRKNWLMFGLKVAYFYLVAVQITLIKFLKKLYFFSNHYNNSIKTKVPSQVYFNPNPFTFNYFAIQKEVV